MSALRQLVGRSIARMPLGEKFFEYRGLLRVARGHRARIDILETRIERLEHLLFAGGTPVVDAFAEALTPRPSGHTFERFGSVNDGGYVLAMDFGPPDVVISIGVGSECQADDDLAQIGARVWQFDHTVAGSPSTHPAVTFMKLGLSKTETQETKKLQDLLSRTDVKSHESVWLMLDAEGVEWDVLDDVATDLSRFAQISMEIHLLSLAADVERARVMVRGLKRLRASHVPVAWHVNNFAPVHIIGGKRVPDVLEVTFVRNAEFVSGSELPNQGLFSLNNPFGSEVGQPFGEAPLSGLGPVPEVLA